MIQIDNSFVRRYRQWLLKYNPLTDCTIFKRHNRLTNKELEIFRNNPKISSVQRVLPYSGNPVTIWRGSFGRPTNKQLIQHLVHQEDFSIYMSNESNREVLLMMMDIDNKDGAGDAQGAAEYLSKTYFNNQTYIEHSTYGHGRHIYFLANVKYIKRIEIAQILINFKKEIILKDENFKAFGCEFDNFYGTPTVWKRQDDEWLVVKRGDCLKLPYLTDGEGGIARVDGLEPISIREASKLLHKINQENQNGIEENSLLFTSASNTPYDIFTKSNFNTSKTEVKNESNALRRMHLACSMFIHQRHRFPVDAFELTEFYETQGFHTGRDVQNRRRHRAEDVLAYQLKHRDTIEGVLFSTETYLRIIKQHVKPDHHVGIKCDREITDLDLAVGLYVIEMNSFTRNVKPKRQFTTGLDSIRGMFVSLKERKVIGRGCNYNLAVAIRKILVNSGLVCCLDDNWIVGGKAFGVAKKFGIGIKHPRYEEWLEFKDKLKEAANRSIIDSPACQVIMRPLPEDEVVRSSEGILEPVGH